MWPQKLRCSSCRKSNVTWGRLIWIFFCIIKTPFLFCYVFHVVQSENINPKYPYDSLMTGRFGRFGMNPIPNGSLLPWILSRCWMNNPTTPKNGITGSISKISRRKIILNWLPPWEVFPQPPAWRNQRVEEPLSDYFRSWRIHPTSWPDKYQTSSQSITHKRFNWSRLLATMNWL